MPPPLVIKHRKGIEDKVNKYKGLERVLFLLQEGTMAAQHDFLDNLANDQHQKMLREIANDAITPKKTNKKVQNDLYEKQIDNDFYEGLDYDDQMIPTAEY